VLEEMSPDVHFSALQRSEDFNSLLSNHTNWDFGNFLCSLDARTFAENIIAIYGIASPIK
jgi:hypothetical protein